jgi:hypothetical protein
MYPEYMMAKDLAQFPPSAALPAEIVLGAAKAAAESTHSARLQELQQQMSVINAHLATLKRQLGLMGV